MFTISNRLDRVISNYEKEHQHPLCIFLHNMGIPLITIGTMSLLGQLPLVGGVDFRYLLLLLNLFYFCMLDVRVGLLYSVFVSGSNLLISYFVNLQYSWICFSLGWALAISGHFIFEKNKPAFFENLSQTLLGVGPMTMFAKFFKLKRPFSRTATA